MIARVLPDLPAVERQFDYLVPDGVGDQVRVGTLVRVDLHGRRVRGWVVDVGEEASPGVDPSTLKPLAKVSSAGPPPEVVGLAAWAAWRWAGRWQHLLRVASPPANVRPGMVGGSARAGATAGSRPLPPPPVVVRQPPGSDRLPVLRELAAAGPAILVVPGIEAAERLAERLRRDGRPVALLAGDVRVEQWLRAAAGDHVVVGTRVAVWAPVPDAALAGIAVVDEHDEALQSEQAPTWHARDVALERAARAAVPCTLLSPTPTLHALAVVRARGELRRPPAPTERAGWPVVDVADRREEDPVKQGPFSPTLARLVHERERGRVVCVVNRLGRSRLLACARCGTTASCERCGAVVSQPDPERLVCLSCATERPPVCLDCGGGRFKNLRMGVARVREELEALAGEPAVEVTATEGDPEDARLAVGTEAVLHRVRPGSVGVVALLDLDQELLAPRYRATEQALVLLARAARALGDRRRGGRLVLQTRQPEHHVVQAALHGDPDRVAEPELAQRTALGNPPAGGLAVVSGAGAEAWAAAALGAARPFGVEVLGPADDRWLVRAPTWDVLADYLAAVPRPPGRLRIEVDPPRA